MSRCTCAPLCLECQDTGYLEVVEFGKSPETCPHCETGREEERIQRKEIDIAGRNQNIRDVLMFEAGLREPRPLNAIDQLAMQTSYASVTFIAAWLRKYFDTEEIKTLPTTVLDAAERTAKVLDQMRKGDQEQWGHIVETMTRAANLLDGSTSEPRSHRSGVATDLREAAEWMRSGGAK